MKILGISTSNHWTKKDSDTSPSKSLFLLNKVLDILKKDSHEIKLIEANKLHIVENQGCYSVEGRGCGSKDAGEYRCWAHYNSVENPEKYGGVDEMPEIYNGYKWADIVIFSTPVRWFSHSAVLQRVIERMNVLENVTTVYGEKPLLVGKKAGVIVIGHNYKADSVAAHLSEVFQWFGFESEGNQLVWQAVNDVNSEDTEKDEDRFKKWLDGEGGEHVKLFVNNLTNTKNDKNLVNFHKSSLLKILK